MACCDVRAGEEAKLNTQTHGVNVARYCRELLQHQPRCRQLLTISLLGRMQLIATEQFTEYYSGDKGSTCMREELHYMHKGRAAPLRTGSVSGTKLSGKLLGRTSMARPQTS